MPTEIGREDAQQLVTEGAQLSSTAQRGVRPRIRPVYDYAAGKSDWMAAGLPTEGAAAGRPTPAIARREVPTCQEGDVTAGSAMRPGPSTFRPHVATEKLAKVMATRDLPNIPVTTSANELIGLLVRGDAKRAVHEHQGDPS